ncbi:MAG: hypothetical protein J6P66_08555 [Bacteroidaceae bacterium]|nr:hypothetical protein [Bacteroidaceae bacterium]
MFKRILSIAWGVMSVSALFGQASYRATFYVDGAKEKEQNRSHTSLESVEPNASVVYATGGVELFLSHMRLNKTSGSISDATHRETGHNSVVLADDGSRVWMDFCDVNSHTPQADGISASGEGTLINVREGTINMSRPGSAAVNATNKSKINVVGTIINIYSNQSPSFYACSEGVVEVTEGKGDNTGQGSPLFYASAGTVKGEKCRMSAAKWAIGCLDDGLLELTHNDLKSNSLCGFLVHGADGRVRESRSSGKLILKNNKIMVNEGPVIFVTNAAGEISLSGNKISCKSDEIISVKGDEWGVKNQNQGDAIITVLKQTLSGDIYVDSISSLTLNLEKGAKLNGRITGKESPWRNVKVSIKKGSTWTMKGDCYLTSITFDQPLEKGLKQIKGKHVIYYDPDDALCRNLDGKEYKTGGGKLVPIKK